MAALRIVACVSSMVFLASPARAQTCAEPNVLVLFDVSGSMGSALNADGTVKTASKYNQAVGAISGVTANTDDAIRYGLMAFPEPGPPNVYCGDGSFAQNVPFATENWDPIYRYISPTLYNSTTANPQFFGGPKSHYDTPMYQALDSVQGLADMQDPSRRNFVLLITDGVQDCARGGDYDSEPDKDAGGAWIQSEYDENRQDLINMVDTLWFLGIDTFVVGFGAAVDATTLNELARWGGTAPWNCTSNCYYQADASTSSLQAALQQIASVVATESCDGIDNDCDGDIDEGTNVDCSTACGVGYEVCQSGALRECNAPAVGSETCDGVDNDCNGTIDDGCACVHGQTKDCGSDVGACQRGTQTCVAGVWQACQGSIGPATETCDGVLDEDCDGQRDEGCACSSGAVQSCGISTGACEPGTSTCSGGQWGACVGGVPPAATDTCDGVDNDCNGTVDDGCGCVQGESKACGSDVGKCEQGTQSCVAGVWQPCQGGVGPAAETCDGLEDEDCDGQRDEGCACVNGAEQRCGTSVGICQPGTSTCVDGQWGPCLGGVQPEGSDACDGLDNDCDNEVDEFCGCEGGETRACGSSHGTCEPGVQTCDAGEWSECEGGVGPVAEVCDNLDNDCDADVDDDATCDGNLACRCGSCVGRCGTNGSCAGDARCIDGFCVFESCPAGSYCDGFICVAGENPDPFTDDDGAIVPKTPSGIEGGCSCASERRTSPLGVLLVLGGLLVLAGTRRRRGARLG